VRERRVAVGTYTVVSSSSQNLMPGNTDMISLLLRLLRHHSIPLQHHLQGPRTQVRIIRYFLDDWHQSCELLAATVCQKCRHARWLHLCILEMQFHKANVEVSLR